MASEIRVNNIKALTGLGTVTISADGINVGAGIITANNFKGGVELTSGSLTGISTIGVTTVTATTLTVNGNAYPSAGPLSNRNLIINGSMQVAQRGTTSTASDFGTVDRFFTSFSGGAVTTTQESLTSGDPYDVGFRNFVRLTNTTAASGAANYRLLVQRVEAQNIANSGWNYTSATSYVTLSFWVRSSVSQAFIVRLQSRDGTNQSYPTSTGTLTADTWTKVTKTIPGNSNIVIDNDNGPGLRVEFAPFWGTDFTDSGVTLDTWTALSVSARTPDMTSTWAGTTDATFDVTGVQLEVGEVATPFEHRSYGQELALCQRYYCLIADGNNKAIGTGGAYSSGNSWAFVHLPVEMRAAPSLDYVSGTGYYNMIGNNASDSFNELILEGQTTSRMARVSAQANISLTQGLAYFMHTNNASAKVAFSAEL